jgi:lipid-A-disaccharide synthase
VATRGREETLRLHELDPARRTVLLLPGSRPKEVELLVPRLAQAVRRLRTAGSYQFALALAHTVAPAAMAAHLRAAGLDVPVVAGDTHNLIAAADIALVTSGTATLECALLECPMVIVYAVSPVTMLVARVLVRGVRNIGMPNIVAGREIVPELIQGAASGERIAAAAQAILDDPARRQRIVEDLRDVRRRLGRGGAAGRAATIAAELLEGREP